jgi:hypothetical protein
MSRLSSLCLLLALMAAGTASAQNEARDKFEQLGTLLPTPTPYRTASGAPGHEYYQQQADYDLAVELDDDRQVLSGQGTITYHNNSPDELSYLWLQLDQNQQARDSETKSTATMSMADSMKYADIQRLLIDFDGGFKLEHVQDDKGNALPYTVVKTMMRIDLPKPLKSKGKVSISLKWHYNINDRMKVGGRSGYEYFKEDKNYLYTIAQFFPRMCVYNEVEGWQHKQFLGRGEFTLPFGDYKVSITVPADHVVAATGWCQNMDKVLTPLQMERFNQAKLSKDRPVIIVTQDEATRAEAARSTDRKTWVYKATNVRDFAFATSRKFIWDAMAVEIGGRTIMAMSYYPKEGNPLWEQYSTRVVAHTLRTYSKYTIDYPYPVAISVHADDIGMEYPMIAFNFGRPEKDGTYSDNTKYRMIGVIIHEVGHNFFPMIINSDERQWTWMDEGLNTFVEYLTEKEWDKDYPCRRGPAANIVDYMRGAPEGMVPIMTNSEQIMQFGNNSYGKPATALNILRETVMGRQLFDFAFKEYARRWAFRHPAPADFFRTMEDASGIDLDWFWRGWFYTNDFCDQGLDAVRLFQIDTRNPEVEKPLAHERQQREPVGISDLRNRDAFQSVVEKDPAARDFYNSYDPTVVDAADREDYRRFVDKLSFAERKLLDSGLNFYQIDISNRGGLLMPVILRFTFSDGTEQIERIPAEVWRMDADSISKVYTFPKELTGVSLDPFLEVADTDRNNNQWPPRSEPSRFQLFKEKKNEENQMQRSKRAN